MGLIEDLDAPRAGGSILTALDLSRILAAVGGAAHLDLIVDCLRGSLQTSLPRGPFRAEVERLLHAHDSDAPDAQAPMFKRPFGSGSSRWTLIDGGLTSYQ